MSDVAESMTEKMRKIKLKKRYAKKRVSLDESFRKTMSQRAKMKKEKKPQLVSPDQLNIKKFIGGKKKDEVS